MCNKCIDEDEEWHMKLRKASEACASLKPRLCEDADISFCHGKSTFRRNIFPYVARWKIQCKKLSYLKIQNSPVFLKEAHSQSKGAA